MNETAVDLRACINNKAMSHVAMPRYGCHKEVHAMPLTRGEYNDVRGWTIPENENPADEGYLVVYNLGTADEYVSWSPKHIFNDGYHPLDTFGVSGHTPLKTENLTFGEALELMKKGYRVAREGWNGAGMFAFYAPESKVIPCPYEQVKREFDSSFTPFRACLILKTAQQDLAYWAPSTSDCLASDWVWLNEPVSE
ncbi:DUF2829 domain-containing protein [Shewanella sp. MM_2022_3]|uniref:DUF2829 domain-containing protein n=1 Tax=Shewanella sp. MM_2022_3 TaxID=2923280 RepID=UPI001F4C01B8|nr:DUF2829 domain-containing protein [Shewanella sp. MM_2022_3]MCH7421293.1 DUF2829 domain-containing protein [Shewanella sp. MM_2022_3]